MRCSGKLPRDGREAAVSATEATARADAIRSSLGVIAEQIDTLPDRIASAFDAKDWDTLGYSNWQSYCHGEFEANLLKLDAATRKPIARKLKALGASTREIGAATGVTNATASRDLNSVTNVTVPSGQVDNADVVDAEIVEDEPDEGLVMLTIFCDQSTWPLQLELIRAQPWFVVSRNYSPRHLIALSQALRVLVNPPCDAT